MAESTMNLLERRVEVFLLIENRLVRETLERFFGAQPELVVVGQAAPTDEIRLPDRRCDIVVLDDLDSAFLLGPTLHLARPEGPKTALVLIGMEENEGQFLAAVRCGVVGYLLNDASANDVVDAVRAAARGEAVCPPRLSLTLFRTVALAAREVPPPSKRGSVHSLTIRQQQLVSLVAKGLTNKEIASQLNLSEFTIKNHIHRIMKQVEAESRHEVVAAVRGSSYGGLV
jgi:DNA-binding NarL/FixJ family response regulator